ncbi:MAG: hypothetical protein DI610_05015 [Staphylococcus hominis]|nr:MAG: hypothetical protein DI610_05015 [Staphylococcus hominis]
MIHLLFAGLLLGSTPVGAGLEHRVELPHASGAVAAHYVGDVIVRHRQTGAVGAPGRPSTLRCQWEASLTVERQARHASGSAAMRSLRRDAVAKGSRVGWCDASRGAIEQEVAARSDEWQRHMLALAEEDRAELLAEIDRLHGTRQG